MPHEGYANPIMNDRPRFHSDMPVSELTEHVAQAIEASDLISTFSFDPSLEPCPQNPHRGDASGPPESVSEMTPASTRR